MVIYAALGLKDNDRSLVSSIGEIVVYDAAIAFINQHNADVEAAYATFVSGTTEGYSEIYKLPGGGKLQRLGIKGRAAATRAGGKWEVAFPLENFGASFEYDRVTYAMLTVQQLANELATIRTQDVATIRHEILLRLFCDDDRNFVDELAENPATRVVKPLANNDAGTLYPPVIGAASDAFATHNHYITSGYAAANISDNNNPLKVIRNHLEEHFGTPEGMGNVCVWIHTDQVDKIKALADFVDVTDIGINPGADTPTVTSAPRGPGRLIGRCDGCWVYEWRWIPSGYLVGVDYDQDPPLKVRVMPDMYGLGQGLQLVAEDSKHPIKTSSYEHWMGVGTANRLNGVVMELTTDGTYDPPAAYASY
jgi:hypothetical protein